MCLVSQYLTWTFYIVASVMYGFGDLWNPLPESVDLMNEIVTEYMEELVCAKNNPKTSRSTTYLKKYATYEYTFYIYLVWYYRLKSAWRFRPES